MILLLDGPFAGHEVDSAAGPLYGVPNSDLYITLPAPDVDRPQLTYRYFISPDGRTARFLSVTEAGPMPGEALETTVERPVLRAPDGSEER